MELKLPLGYVFEPTDQVLIEHYLLKLMTSQILSVIERNLVSECDLYNEEGLQEAFQRIEELEDEEENDDNDARETSLDRLIPSGTLNKELFFFTSLKKKSHNGNRINRSVGKGTWKGLDKGQPILDSQGRCIGIKRTFNYENKGSAHHLQWDMKEYSLDGITLKNPNIKVKDYVICKIKKKARARERKRARIENQVAEEEIGEPSHVKDGAEAGAGAGARGVLFNGDIEKQTLGTAATKTDIFNIEDDYNWVMSNISFDDLNF